MNSTISIDNAIAEAGFTGGAELNNPQSAGETLGSGISSTFELPAADSVMPGVGSGPDYLSVGAPTNEWAGSVPTK